VNRQAVSGSERPLPGDAEVAQQSSHSVAGIHAEHGRARYGDSDFGRGCLMALRLVERGVRMVQIYFGNGQPWDNHDDIQIHRRLASQADPAIAALLEDLKSRGLLAETVVIIGGEFGRTPSVEVSGLVPVQNGRDHNNHDYSLLLAGGGFKGGTTYGSTDDFGFKAVDKPVHAHDIHATVLHLLGLDHTRLTYRHSGRDFRLTDVEGRVIHDILARPPWPSAGYPLLKSAPACARCRSTPASACA